MLHFWTDINKQTENEMLQGRGKVTGRMGFSTALSFGELFDHISETLPFVKKDR